MTEERGTRTPQAGQRRFDQHAFETALAEGYRLLGQRAFEPALERLEHAHRIGQSRTLPHTRVHVALLAWGWLRRDGKEVAGQLVRIPYSALFTWLWVPAGNRGSELVGSLWPGGRDLDLSQTALACR